MRLSEKTANRIRRARMNEGCRMNRTSEAAIETAIETALLADG